MAIHLGFPTQVIAWLICGQGHAWLLSTAYTYLYVLRSSVVVRSVVVSMTLELIVRFQFLVWKVADVTLSPRALQGLTGPGPKSSVNVNCSSASLEKKLSSHRKSAYEMDPGHS